MAKNEMTWKVNIDAEIESAVRNLNTLKGTLKNALDSKANPALNAQIADLDERLARLIEDASKPIRSKGMFTSLLQQADSLNTAIGKVDKTTAHILQQVNSKKINFLPKEEKERLQSILNLLNQAKTLSDNQIKTANKQTKAEAEVNRKEAERNALLAEQKKLQDQLDKNDEVRKTWADTQEAYGRHSSGQDRWDKRSNTSHTENGVTYNYRAARDAFNGLPSDEETTKITSRLSEISQQIKNYNATIATSKNQVESTKAAQTELSNSFIRLLNAAKDTKVPLEGVQEELNPENIESFINALYKVIDEGLVGFNAQLANAHINTEQFSGSIDELTSGLERNRTAFEEENEAAKQVEGLTSRIKQFTGLSGAAIVMRRALQNAVATIKELDEQMTQMAVVTDLKVGDYWKQLPEHTERANALGMAIKDVYEAETLYYQQGLKTAEVTALSTSTLKMARIAGLSAEDATNKMTAALRGFNMEINETNADRIADVYSKLAAITASDVEEISTAMTRTASLAHNAGMEFETTAAFLSQIIETTRESAETAGTALKTVIARFQELKKSPDEIGEVDGEIVDANKIETALRSVDVALRDTTGQFRNLDEVFLELASKWDTLDTNTQRYIATIAAGSRQQSRFIAMMSDYNRTQELVVAANNAQNASQEQFNKTLDSLQSKLAALKNAWDSFSLGLTNSDLVKNVVDMATKLLDIINKITKGWDSASGSLLKLGVTFAGLKTGNVILKNFTKTWQQTHDVLGSFGAGLKAPIKNIRDFIKNISVSDKKLMAFRKSLKAQATATQKFANIQSRAAAATEAFKEANAKRLQEGKALNELSQEELTSLKRNFAVRQQGITLEQEANKATAERTAAQAALFASYKFTDAEMENYNKLVVLGCTEDEAAALTKNGVTAAIYEEKNAEERKLLIEKYGHAVGLKSIVIDKAKTLATTGVTGSLFKLLPVQLQNTIMNKLQEKTNLSLAASFGYLLVIMLPTIAAVGALVAIGFGLVALFKQIHKESPQGQFEAASEALKSATENADRAKEAYDGLKESWESLNETYDGIDDLVVGTREWQEALLGANGQVLDLLDKFPQLQKYVTNVNGLLKISQEGMDFALNEQMKIAQQAQAAQQAATIAATQAEVTLDYSKMSHEAITGDSGGRNFGAFAGGVVGGALGRIVDIGDAINTGEGIGKIGAKMIPLLFGAITPIFMPIMRGISNMLFSDQEYLEEQREATDELARKLASGAIDVAEAMRALGTNSQDAVTELRRYGEELLKTDAQIEATRVQMLNSAINMIDANKYTAEQMNIMRNVGSAVIQNFTKSALDEVQKIADERKLDKDDAYKKYWEGVYGEGNVKIGNTGEIEFTVDGETKKLAAEQARSQYASAKATQELAKVIVDLPSELTTASAKRAFKDAQGMGLTRKDLDKANINDWIQAYANSPLLQQLYATSDDFIKDIAKRYDNAMKAYEDVDKRLFSSGLTKFDNSVYDFSAAEEKALTSHLAQVVAVSGSEMGRTLQSTLTNLLNSTASEDRANLLSAVQSIDWHDANALEGLMDVIDERHINVSTQAMQDFIDQAKEAAHAIHRIDANKLKETALSYANILKGISTGTQGRTFDNDVYQQIVSANKDLAKSFVQDLNGAWIYTGSKMDTLTDAINANTSALVKENVDILTNKITAADILDTLLDSNKRFWGVGSVKSIDARNSWTIGEQRSFLQEFINYANKNGLKIDGISSVLSNSTRAEGKYSISDEQVQTALADLFATYGRQDEFRDQIYDINLNTNAARYQSQDVYRNAREWTNAQITQDNVGNFQSQRRALFGQMTAVGLSDQDLQRLTDLDEKMKEYEEDIRHGNVLAKEEQRQYSALRAEWNKLNAVWANETGYQEVRQNLKELLETNQSFMEEYIKTMDPQQQRELVQKMYEKFGIEVTQENQHTLAVLMDQLIHGEEGAFEAIINMAGEQAGVAGNVFAETLGKTMEEIDSGPYKSFVDFMVGKNFAQWDEKGQLVWGLETALDLAKALGEEFEKWQSPYDWLYNANQRINGLMRQRNIYENDYQRLLENTDATYEDLADNVNNQIDLLTEEAEANQRLYEGAKASLIKYMNEINHNDQLAALRGSIAVGPGGSISVDKDKLYGAGFSSDVGGVVEDMIGAVEESLDTMNDAVDKENDTLDAILKIQSTGKDAYKELVTRVQDSMRETRQKEIDKMSQINDTINDAQSKLVTKMQEQIDQSRQQRENEKKEQELSDKQMQLAYLKASGGSSLDILKLEKDIANEQEAYQDSLVDQQLQDMEKANQEAANQRERQIEIAQAQLDYWDKYMSALEADKIVQESAEQIAKGTSPLDTKMAEMLGDTDHIETMPQVMLEEWNKALTSGGNLATLYTALADEEVGIGAKAKQAGDDITAAYNKVSGDLLTLQQGNKDLLTKVKEISFPNAKDWDNQIQAWITELNKIINGTSPGYTPDNLETAAIKSGLAKSDGESLTFSTAMYSKLNAIEGYHLGDGFFSLTKDWDSHKVAQAVDWYLQGGHTAEEIARKFNLTPDNSETEMGTIAMYNSNVPNSVRTGMADIKTAVPFSSNNTTYDIQINVESLDSDYGVDGVAHRMEELIMEKANYRATTAVNKTR